MILVEGNNELNAQLPPLVGIIDGRIIAGYARWAGIDWVPITDTWPSDTGIETRIVVENTGNVAADFKVFALGLFSNTITLAPGEKGNLDGINWYRSGEPRTFQYDYVLYVDSIEVDRYSPVITVY